MRLTFYSKESIVLLLNKTNLSNTIFAYYSKLILTTFLLVLFTNVSFGNTDTNNEKPSNYFSTQIHNYSKTLLTKVIKELQYSQELVEFSNEWLTLYQRFSTESSCTNLLTNEEFDNGTTDWQLDVDGSTAAGAVWNIDNSNQLSGANSVFVNITNSTNLEWNIQLLQQNKSVVVGQEYQVVFEARATAERDMVAAVQKNSGTWDTYGSRTVNLTTKPQTYSFKFIAPETNTGGVALIFHLAKSTDNVFIDNVRFSETCVAEICNNNIDDDGDGLIDNADSDCSATIGCTSCVGTNLFDNPSFENGTWTGSETFVTGASATNIDGAAPSPLNYWGSDDSKWVESNKATDGNRFVYLNKDVGDPVCFSQRYTFGAGNEINDCDTYQICFDWASFNSDFSAGRTTVSQPSVDFVFRDNANQKIKFVSIPLGTATANQNWNNLIWESVSFAFKFEGNLTVPANTANIDVLISERDVHDNGLLLDNTSLCVVNSCSDGCSVTNMYPGFALDPVGDNCSWLDYTLDNDLNFTNNGDGTATIAGKIVDGVDADWDGVSCTASPCGVDDSWYLTLNLSNKQNWTELQAAGGTANVHTNCSTDNLDYWDVTGTLTGLGCNSGRTLTINSAASNYRLQIGYGGNSNDSSCAFGLSTWFNIEENGSSMQADIYAFLDASCYNKPNSCNLQFDNVVVSNCINQPLMDVATVDATISWTAAPADNILEVSIDNKTEYIDVVGGATSPQTIRFTIPADGSTGNKITAKWSDTNDCNQAATYNAPSACSSNEINCDILYICGDDKPFDGDPWDHGWIEYLDAVNGSKGITAAFSKPDASGMGLYDPNNTNNLLVIDFNDYDLIIVSATTEDRLSNDIIDSLGTTAASVLNSNYTIVDDLGMSDYNASYTFQDFAYTDATNSETIYNFNNDNPSYTPVILRGHYLSNADVLLWRNGADYASGTDGVLFHNTSDDVLTGIANHGNRVFLGYHMNGVYANAENGGAIPTPDSLWFNPAKHLTLAGKMYLDSALVLAAANCGVTSTNEVCTCSNTNLFDNPGFELGVFTGADEFLPGVPSDYLGWNWGTPTVLDGWSHGALHWIESPNSNEGDRMVYINNPSGGAVCQGQYYDIGSGLGQLAECATYQMCFDWASFNRENPTGRNITSQPAIDFVWFDADGNDLGVKHQILGVPVANQDWDNLIWSSVSFSFSLTEMYAPPANATRVRINISEHNGEDNGMLIDNANLCEIIPCTPTCCTQINYANNSLEEGNFSSFTSSSNPDGIATLTTFGGSAAVDWNPTDGRGTNGSPITAFGANPGYWVDASTNGGLGALDGDRFYWLEPRNGATGSDCIGAANGADLLGSFCAGDTMEICGYVAAYDPNNINSSSVSTDFKFEIYSNNGNDPADFITTPVGTTSTNDNGGDNESFTLPLPASTNILDITGAPFTGVNGQVADWRTLNWQSICFQVVLKEDQSNYRSIIFSMADNSDGMAVDNLSIRDITTPNAGKDITVYTCSPRLNLKNANSEEEWSKVTEPAGAAATIDASTGVVTGLTENGIYKFLLSKTNDVTCHDTIRVQVNCTSEICDDGIDNDGDGLTDCEDPDCNSITVSKLSYSECVLTGSEYQATMSIEVSWSNPPAGEGINVITPDNSQFIDIVGGATSPYTVQFVIAADNSTNPLSIAYTGGNSCGFDSYYDAPAPCPDPTERNMPCTNGSGYVGGIVFEDLSGDGLQDEGEPGLEGIMVTATDSLGVTVGQTSTNNIGVFEFADLTDGGKFKLEFTAIPSGMYPTNGSTYKGTTVQFVDAPSCATTLGLLNPTTNACEATSSTILQNGYSVVACLPAGDDVTLAIKDITQLGTLWQTSANRNTNQFDNVPTIRMWETSDFEGEEIFSMAIDPRDGTIYAVASPLYGDGSNTASVLFEENIAPKVFKINPETGVVTRIAQLSGTLGLGAIDFDVINEQLLITNMDDGKIYRLNTDGVVLNSYDPLAVDNGISSQLPNLGDRILGIAFNPIDKRVYYSVWSNHMTFTGSHENINNNYNTIRSVSLDADGDFIPSTDQLEITVPYNPGHTVTLTAPTADIAFNRAGDRLLIAEFAIIENNSGSLSTAAHASVVREFQEIAGVWTLEPTYGSNYQGKYDIGSVIDYRGRNSRGGIDWAYERVSGDTIFGDDDFIIATGDALHVASRDGDYIYGYQFTPAIGGNIANSILVDLDNDLINPDKYVYSDVDIYKNYCAALTLEIGNYVWLDSDEDGVQDLYEVGLAGINVTLFNAAGDSLTSVVTDANGAYYFNDNTSGFAGLTPNTTYYVVVGRGGQFNKTNGALNFVFDLTVSSIGDGNYKDENDSDGVIGNPSYGHPVSIAGYPIIEVTTGENGQNDYSFDFGFKEICSAAIVVNDSIPTCPGVEYEGSVSLNDSNYEDKLYSVLTNPDNGTVTMGTNGTFSYVGNASTCISDEFSYQVCDPSQICCSIGIVYLDFADAIKPSLQNIPDNDTISCDELVPLPPQIFAIDNCPGISLDVKEDDTQGEDGCSLYDYTITRTWTAIDICGNSTSASQVIEVQDVVAPDIYRVYTLPNGKKMVAGVMELVGGNWKTVSLPIDFDTKPIILHQVTTNDGLTPVVAQIQNVSVSQFELRIVAEEANTTKRTRESVSWIAMEAGTQSTDYQLEMNSVLLSKEFKTVNFQNSFASTPAIFTSAQTTNEADPASIRHDLLTTSGVALKVQEETSNDSESLHLDERVGYLALEKIGDLRDEEGILLGEVGTISLDDQWTTITLNNTYANPVIVANSLSINGAEPATVRIQNVGLNSFQVKVEEWAYLDGGHGNETVSYMVVEGSIPLESPNYCEEGTDSLDIGIDFKAVDNCDVSVIINYTEKDTFIGANKVITRTWAAEDECGNATSYSQQISCEGVSLQLKSILQGAMLDNNGDGLMRDDLRKKGLLPLQEPYSKMPLFEHVNTGGGEVMDPALLTVNGADGIVDWVFVELRDANDVKNVIATQSVLIQCDGDVVTVKGDSIIQFSNTRVGDYFVALRHRNHLGMITLNTESFTPSNIPFVDFTFAFTPVVGSNSSVKVDNMESLWSGDLNSDGKVIYQGPNNDIFHMFLQVLQDEGNHDFLPNFISNDYTINDFNLDGTVIYQGPNNDRAKLLFNTILRHPENVQKFSNFIIYGAGN